MRYARALETTTVLIYIWDPHCSSNNADPGHSAIEINTQYRQDQEPINPYPSNERYQDIIYRSIWPASDDFPQLGFLKALPLRAAMAETYSHDKFMQAKEEHTAYVISPDPKHEERQADYVFELDPKYIDVDLVKKELLLCDEEFQRGLMGYKFFDNTDIVESIFNPSTAQYLTLCPFSENVIEESSDRFKQPDPNLKGYNCTSLVLRCINAGLDEQDKITTNRFFIWKKSPRKLAIDLNRSHFAHEKSDEYSDTCFKSDISLKQ